MEIKLHAVFCAWCLSRRKSGLADSSVYSSVLLCRSVTRLCPVSFHSVTIPQLRRLFRCRLTSVSFLGTTVPRALLRVVPAPARTRRCLPSWSQKSLGQTLNFSKVVVPLLPALKSKTKMKAVVMNIQMTLPHLILSQI